MKRPPIPDDEEMRLSALHELRILDTPDEPTYDLLTSIVKKFFNVQIVAISLVDKDRQWFKSIQGIDVKETSREVSFCGHTICQNEPMVINDTHKDKRFFDNPLVTDSPKIRFYAGAQLVSKKGYNLGTLCLIDEKPQELSENDKEMLKNFAKIVQSEYLNKHLFNIYLQNIAAIQEMYIKGVGQHRLFDKILTFLISITTSMDGFIGVILKKTDNVPYLKIYAMTDMSWGDLLKQQSSELSQQTVEIHNLNTLIGHTIHTNEIVISNDPKNDPRSNGNVQGLIDIKSYLGMPIFGQSGLIAMFGLINRKGGYAQRLIDDLTPIIALATAIIESSRNALLIENQANYDSLTGVYNRFHFNSAINKQLKQSQTEENHSTFYLMMIDFNDFKVVNDYYSHQHGDELLIEFCRRIESVIKAPNLLARIGGDEFVVILRNLNDYLDAGEFAEKIINLSRQPYLIKNETIQSSVSIGLACYPLSGESIDELMKNADLALYAAKKDEKSYAFFSKAIEHKYHHQKTLEISIIDAFKNESFTLNFQPQFNMRSKELVGIEALIRCPLESNLTTTTSELVRKIEAIGKAKELNFYVLQKALEKVQNLNFNTPLKLAINISPCVLNFDAHLHELINIIKQKKINPALQVELELAESEFFKHVKLNKITKETTEILKIEKIGLVLNHFGADYSSLKRIMEYHFSTIKIDSSFVKKIDSNQSKVALCIIKAIACIAQGLSLRLIAEDVSSETQQKELIKLGCIIGQGNMFSRALTFEKLNELYFKINT